MTAPTQAQVRSWARSQGKSVNQRGSLPADLVQAYLAAEPVTAKNSSVSAARKQAPRRSAATAKAAKPGRRREPVTKGEAAASASASAVSTASMSLPAPPPPGSVDLAGGLRTYLSAVEAEVRAVTSLSERIDVLVTELNDLRDQQAKRLVILDELRASVTDPSLGAFLNQAIKPRKTRVREVVPERLVP